MGDVRPAESEQAPCQSASWPVDGGTLSGAREFLSDCAGERVVIASDSDVDGLASAVIIERGLLAVDADVEVMPVRRGEHVHTGGMRDRIRSVDPARLIVLDMGSRPEPILPGLPTLLIDHHDASRGLPPGALVVNGFDRPPVAPTSVLAYIAAAHLPGGSKSRWLAALGAVADLGTSAPFIHVIGERVSVTPARKAAALLNAARRAPHPDATVALDTLRAATNVQDIVSGRLPGAKRLEEMQLEVRSEMERCSRVPPKTTGQVALIRFSSGAQVHPVVAMRWSGRLRPRIVIAANDGYLPGRTNFAIRCADEVDLLKWLRDIPFVPSAGAEYANGHSRATGGSLATEDFDRFVRILGLG